MRINKSFLKGNWWENVFQLSRNNLPKFINDFRCFDSKGKIFFAIIHGLVEYSSYL